MSGLLEHLVWREPLWLWLAASPWLIWAARTLLRHQTHAYADPALLPWASAPDLNGSALWCYRQPITLALTWLLFAAALAGPRMPLTVHDRDRDQYTELMVVLDLSRSMSARDSQPGRLQRARLELEDLIARAERLRIGIVVYGHRPHLLTPPTDDKVVLRHYLRLLRLGLLPTEGSDLTAALAFAGEQFRSQRSAHALLVISDGELTRDDAQAEQMLRDQVADLAHRGVRIYALGIGSVEGAPLQAADGSWLKHQGQPVVSRLNEQRLVSIAEAGNGLYSAVSDSDSDWQRLHDNGIRRLEPRDGELGDGELTEWQELYAFCLIPAVALLLLGQTRLRPRRDALAMLPAVIIASALILPAQDAMADDWQRLGYQAYQQQDWLDARRSYARVAGFAGRMGEGAAAYQLTDYADAARQFTQAILDADHDEQRAQAIFNLANSRYQQQAYALAAELYREALRYAPEHAAARTNLPLALLRMTEQRDAAGDGRKPGRGARSVRLPDGSEVGGGNLGIDQSEDDEAARDTPSTLGELEPSGGGAGFMALSTSDRPRFDDAQWRYAITTPERIALRAATLSIDEAVLWQRMFELEEGFPAPLEVPRSVPEVRPW